MHTVPVSAVLIGDIETQELSSDEVMKILQSAVPLSCGPALNRWVEKPMQCLLLAQI